MTLAVEAAAVTQSFGAVAALHSFDLSLEAGERLAVLGDNGAGKTTLLRILATVTRPDSGRLVLLGVDAIRRRSAVKGRIGHLGHRPGLYPALTAIENLRLFCTLHGIGAARALDLLGAVGLAAEAAAPAGNLSRGQQQRLALARALIHDPALLILDEPDAGLDAGGRALLQEVVGGRTVVLATHDRALAACLCERSVTLRAGRADPAGAGG